MMHFKAIRFILFLITCMGLGIGADAVKSETFSTEKLSQSVFIDVSQKMTFEDVSKVAFAPHLQTEKLPFSDQNVWLQLNYNDSHALQEDLYLRVMPVLLSGLTLYQNTENEPEHWQVKTFSANELNAPIKLEKFFPQSKVFLSVKSKVDFRMFLSVANQDAMSDVQRRIDIFFSASITMMLVIAGLSVFHLVTNFNRISLSALFLSTSVAVLWVAVMGFLPYLFNIDQSQTQDIVPIFLCFTIFAFLMAWFGLARQLFSQGKRIQWVGGVALALGLNFLYSFHDGNLAIVVLENMFIYGKWVCLLILCLQAIETKNQLSLLSEKITFLLLIFPLARPAGLPFDYMGVFLTTENLDFTRTILFRVLFPFSFFLMTYWSYNKFTQNRISTLSQELKDANLNLERESSRLDHQRKFTAMIAHELKNPLMASQMALGVIKSKLASEDPTQKRVASIGYSLQEIDDIIERCSEIDKYEQGYLPLAFERISIKELLASIQASQPNERIYVITRGFTSDLEIRTDTHYLKIILNNLISNALKYSPGESLVEFKVEQQKITSVNQLTFCVSNELGSDAAPDPHRIFERYYREESAKKQSGAGLGLWLSQSMAKDIGSQIDLSIEENLIRFHFSILI